MAILVQTLGLSTASDIRLAEDSRASPRDIVSGLDDWLAEAQAHHPAIVAARAQWIGAQEKIKAVRSEGLPRMDFEFNYYQNGYPNQGLQPARTHISTVGVTLTIPIFEGFARHYKLRGAEAQAEQREAELADAEHQILTEVVKAHADAMSSFSNLEASEILLHAAEEALMSSQRRYAMGVADILELLNTQSSLTDARLERVRCETEWRSARLRLMADTGVMNRFSVSLP